MFILKKKRKKMIISEDIHVIINSSNFEYYKELGYEFSNNKNIILVNSKELLPSSKIRINAKCDYCDSINNIKNCDYVRLIKKHNNYYCVKCKGKRGKETCMIKYGVESVSQLKQIREKIKKSFIEKFGVDNPMKNADVMNKVISTNIKKYGTKYAISSEEVKEKSKNTMMERYGVDNYVSSNNFIEKSQKTCLKKYGVPNAQQCKEIREKTSQTRIDKGIQIPNHLIDPFTVYKRIVRKITSKNKKYLFEKWDGLDFYDNQYIRGNLKKGFHSDYPTIDHKISIKYGFLNEIPPEEIAKIENLCITKHRINSSKGDSNESEYTI